MQFVEFLPNGQAYPDSKFFQFQVDMYTGSTDTSSFVIEMVLLFAILFFLKVELNKVLVLVNRRCVLRLTLPA